MRMFNFLMILLPSVLMISCGNSKTEKQDKDDFSKEESISELLGLQNDVSTDSILNYVFEYDENGYPVKRVYDNAKEKKACFLVISKVHPEHLSVYEVREADTVLLATYPVCLSRNKGQKERKGDNKTPESYPGEPFYISQIQDASDWHHDFGDGRGSILAYGHWFMRLVTPGFSGIGIHGSTGNRHSIVDGRGSEGCIRLLDEDIMHLHDNYAIVGTKVIILPEDFGPLDFELIALKKKRTHISESLPQVENKDILPNEVSSIKVEEKTENKFFKAKNKKRTKGIEDPVITKTWPSLTALEFKEIGKDLEWGQLKIIHYMRMIQRFLFVQTMEPYCHV